MHWVSCTTVMLLHMTNYWTNPFWWLLNEKQREAFVLKYTRHWTITTHTLWNKFFNLERFTDPCVIWKTESKIRRVRQDTCGSNSFKSFDPKLRNSLTYHLRTLESLNTFKEVIKSWNGVSRSCCICHTWCIIWNLNTGDVLLKIFAQGMEQKWLTTQYDWWHCWFSISVFTLIQCQPLRKVLMQLNDQ